MKELAMSTESGGLGEGGRALSFQPYTEIQSRRRESFPQFAILNKNCRFYSQETKSAK